MKNDIKVKLFTHTDLDGVGCAILGTRAFGAENIDITYCSYKYLDRNVLSFYQRNLDEDYDLVLITDLGVTKETAEELDSISRTRGLNLINIDHHAHAMYLNDYPWGVCKPTEDGVKLSGTYLLYEYLINEDYIQESEENLDLVTNITEYDTWLFKEKNNQLPKDLNDIFYTIGRQRFYDDFTKNAPEKIEDMMPRYRIFLILEREKIRNYIKSKIKETQLRVYNGHKVAVVMAERYISELGESLAREFPEAKYVAMITGVSTVSLRKRPDSDIDLSEIAFNQGGGGHVDASGFPVDKPVAEAFLNSIFINTKEESENEQED